MKFLNPVRADMWWSAEGLPFGSVAWLIPNSDIYPAFTRIFHPVPRRSGLGEGSWRGLSVEAGLVWHSQVQFAHLSKSEEYNDPWLGNLGYHRLHRLTQILRRAEDARCVVALWEGDSWISSRVREDVDSEHVGIDAGAWDQAARLACPNRRTFRLFESSLPDVSNFGVRQAMFTQKQPTILWAADHSFTLATDPDYDSTILASDRDIQAEVLRDNDLEALGIDAGGSLLANADVLNSPQPRPSK
jgi:hypothetical protein